MHRWLQRSRDERGAVLPLIAICLTVLIGSTALAVDIGQLTDNNRTLQSRADIIALDAARTLTGQTAAALSGSTGATVLAVQGSATRNGTPFSSLTVELGSMSGTTFTAVATPVLDGVIQTVTNTAVPKAVRITAKGSVDFAFRPGETITNRAAVAVQENQGGFSIGSWLASVSSGDSLVLDSLFGQAFNFNAVSYDGLLNGTVTLEELGLHMPAGVLSPSVLLDTSVSIDDFMAAAISAMNARGNTAAANVLEAMKTNVTARDIRLGDFITVDPGGETPAATASLDMLQLLTAAAMVTLKSDGHALSIPTTTVSIPGITSLTASATVIEPPGIYFGPVNGTSITTAQVRLSVDPVINATTATGSTDCTLSLADLLGLLGCLLHPLLPLDVALNGSLPLDVTASGATGTLTAVDCATPSIRVGSTTQAVNLNAGANLNLDVTLLDSLFLNAARVNIAAGAKTTPSSYSTTFVHPGEFSPNPPKSVGSGNLGLNGLLNVTSADISVLHGTLNTAAVSSVISSLVVPVLNDLLSSLDTALVVPLGRVLGAQFGGADIAALGYSCNGRRLAA